MKKNTADAGMYETIKAMEVNRMYQLPGDSDFKWAMIEHNKHGYCWTIGPKGVCTVISSTDTGNEVKYWTSEAEAKRDLIRKIC